MKTKGTTNKVSKINFWRIGEDKVPNDLKEMVFDQFYNRDTLYVYCDSSCSKTNNFMAVACTYVRNGSQIIKKQPVYAPQDCIGKNIYGELKSVCFGLLNFKNSLAGSNNSVILFSDVNDIERILSKELVFNNNDSLKKIQMELITLYERKKIENPKLRIEIKYLPLHYRRHNPFMKASHNASRKILRRNLHL